MSTPPIVYTPQQLGSKLDALTKRVTAPDGQGLPQGTQGRLPKLDACIQGTKRDLREVTGTMQQKLNTLQNLVNNFTTSSDR
jgi:hypothetical protein